MKRLLLALHLLHGLQQSIPNAFGRIGRHILPNGLLNNSRINRAALFSVELQQLDQLVFRIGGRGLANGEQLAAVFVWAFKPIE